jgi:hypothetical protein
MDQLPTELIASIFDFMPINGYLLSEIILEFENSDHWKAKTFTFYLRRGCRWIFLFLVGNLCI